MNEDIINSTAENFFINMQGDQCHELLMKISENNFAIQLAFEKLESNEIYILSKKNNLIICTLSEGVTSHSYKNILAKHWINSLIFFLRLFIKDKKINGYYTINIGDFGSVPGIAFSDFRDGYCLIPDPIFVMTNGYEDYKSFYRNSKKYSEKIDSVYWRGATTGFTDLQGGQLDSWRTIARVQLCEYCLKHSMESNVQLDVFISNVVQIESEHDQKEILKSNVIKNSVNWTKFGDYKYQIDVDGNSNSWPGLFLKLLTASPVLKIESALGFRQWYYDRLIPWYNFIPIHKDLSNLIEAINWLHEHPIAAEEIGKNGYHLAMSMTSSSEEINSIRTISLL